MAASVVDHSTRKGDKKAKEELPLFGPSTFLLFLQEIDLFSNSRHFIQTIYRLVSICSDELGTSCCPPGAYPGPNPATVIS